MFIKHLKYIILTGLLSLIGFQSADAEFYFGKETKLYRRVVEHIDKKEFKDAKSKLYKLVKISPNKAEYQFQLGICFYNNHLEFKKGKSEDQISKSIEYFEKAIELSNGNVTINDIYYYLGYAYHHDDRFVEADSILNIFLKYIDQSKKGVTVKYEVEALINQCNFGKVFKENAKSNLIINLGFGLNTEFTEHTPLFNSNEDLMLFTSRRSGTTGGLIDGDREYFEDVYMAKKISPPWNYAENSIITDFESFKEKNLQFSPPEKLNKKVNSISHDAAITFINDSSIYMYRGAEIFKSNYRNGDFEIPEKIDIINPRYYEPGNISITADGKKMFLVSEQGGGKGGKDIYMVSKDENGKWGKPINLGDPINSEFNETSPFITPDGNTLYFSSKGHSSMGGYDIFKSQYSDSTNTWSQPENLGYPINRASDDLYFILNKDKNRGYFASNRTDGNGSLDNYVVLMGIGLDSLKKDDIAISDSLELPEIPIAIALPIAEVALAEIKGLLLVEKTLRPSGARISLFDSQSNAKLGTFTANELTGKFYILAPQNKCYKYQIIADGFETVEQEICIPENQDLYEMYQEINILPTKYEGNKVICQTTKIYSAFFDILNKTKADPIYKRYIDKTAAYSAYIKTISPDSNFITNTIVFGDCPPEEIKIPAKTATPTFALRNVFFDFAKSNLRQESIKELDKLYYFLAENSTLICEIAGHTDAIGDAKSNLNLSIRRAQSVVNFLVAKGIEPRRLFAKGYGESRPIARNSNPDGTDNPLGRQLNRRIEITILGEEGKLNVIEEIPLSPDVAPVNSKTDNLEGRKQKSNSNFVVDVNQGNTQLTPIDKNAKSKNTQSPTVFTVQILLVAGNTIPVDIADKLIGLPDVNSFQSGKNTIFTSGIYNSKAEANKLLKNLKSQGFEKAIVIPLPTTSSKVNLNN